MVSPEIEIFLAPEPAAYDIAVARERWSRLRLKYNVVDDRRANFDRGKGAVVSPEIEIHHDGLILRDKMLGGKGAVVSPEIEIITLDLDRLDSVVWQGSGGLA